MPDRCFAVIDGAHFHDLVSSLPMYGLTGTPLYLEGGDDATRNAAGFLVPLHDEIMVRQALKLVGEKPAAVFWSWPGSDNSLYRHLRTLNLVEIPNEARAEAEADGEDTSEYPPFEPVLFRHWDPNVLASLLPLLDGPQRARFLGAGQGLVFDAPDFGGLRVLPRPPDLPQPVTGMLRFSREQMEGVARARHAASHARISAYLVEFAPNETKQLPSSALDHAVDAAVASGQALGLRSEQALGLWAYLVFTSQGRITEVAPLRAALREKPEQADNILFGVCDALRSAQRRLP